MKTKDPLLLQLTSNVRNLRLKNEWTQEDVARMANLSYKYYQSFEGGRISNPSYLTIKELTKLFKIEYWQLFHPSEISEAKIKKMKPKKKR